jgi:hypothetical protein
VAKRPKKDKGKGLYETKSEVRRWTFTAVECYLRGCVCKGCYYNDFFKKTREEYGLELTYRCGMKAMVMELVRVFGQPDLDAPYAFGIQKELDESETDL